MRLWTGSTVHPQDGGVIAKGYHPEVDELRSIRDNTKTSWLS